MTTPFQIVDVFADASLSTDTTQRITRWLNLSETCFVLPATVPA